ncbi:MAG: two-component sensor histidine kinase [Lachnospiraceae bacterium]|nr:two-component sensor histidine kinase [Lachnospiraceae bacterium]
MKRSIRKQLIFMTAAIVAAVLLFIAVIDSVFLGFYYEWVKTKGILDCYHTIDSMSIAKDSEEEKQELEKLASAANVQLMITDTGFEPVFTTAQFAQDMQARLFGYYTGLYRDDVLILRSTENYTIQRTSDSENVRYLELWGELGSGFFVLIRAPLQSIRESARISNRFNLVLAIFAIIVSMVVIWLLSKQFTDPIVELTNISSRMAKLDFMTKYRGRGKDGNEIDLLGLHMNEMSEVMENTISELKSANVELQKDVEKKTQIDNMRIEFLNNVSHELKTPIALIQGYAEGLKDNIADDEESRDYYCDVIIDESAKMNRLVMQLLNLNKLEFGNEQLQMEHFDLVGLIHSVLQGMNLMLREQNAEVYFPYRHPVFVWGDKFKIEEVFTNYMSNALHHLDYARKIDIQIMTEGDIVRTSVFNTGDRIPEEELPKIWEKFYKVDKARTRAYGGTGIGLSIVKAIMDAHGQQCGVENFENGVAFWFTLEGKDPTKDNEISGGNDR